MLSVVQIVVLSELSQTEKDKYLWYHLHVESKKEYKWIYLQDRLTEQTYGYQWEKGEG